MRKFFDNIDHKTLYEIIKRKVTDLDVLRLIYMVLDSFETSPGKGLPLGNVTSQLFANVYLNELDQYVKHTLKIKYYVRYCDDFIILDTNPSILIGYIQSVGMFLKNKLDLSLHPHKIVMRKCLQGMDFLGYVVLPQRTVLRTKTKRRILKKIRSMKTQMDRNLITLETFDQKMQSYLGILTHCSGYKMQLLLLSIST